MTKRKHSRRQPSLAQVLDQLLEQGASEKEMSFRKLAEIAQLDPSSDFVGASLQNIDMRDEDLRDFDFSHADLTGADFRRANVQGVRFNNANLTGAIGLHASTDGHPERLDLGEALNDLGLLLKRLLGNKITLEIAHDRDLWPVKVDISRVEQVIVNLVANSRDAMPDGGKLRLRARNLPAVKNSKRTDFVEVSINDTGIGIRPEIAARLFQPGFVGWKEKASGTGHGLFIARSLIRQMGGDISFDPKAGLGTTFRVLIPRHLPIAGQTDAVSVDPKKDFDLAEVHSMIMAGQRIPEVWIPSVVELDFSYNEVHNLKLLEEFTNLERLNLAGASIVDVTQLAPLTSLRWLDLSSTPITSVTPLSGLLNLQYLNLKDTEVRDVVALAQLKDLRILDLSGTKVKDILPLANLLQLEGLDLTDTNVVGVTALARLVRLKTLSLSHTKVHDVSSLASLTYLENCNLSVTSVSDISALARLKKLSQLSLRATSVNSVSSLARLKDLKSIDLSFTDVRDLSPLTGLKKLEQLELLGMRVNDENVLRGIRGLRIKT
jgi:uncharacterized protein YjbI with pentapeptide repeats